MANLYAVTDTIVKNINSKYYGDDPQIDEELKTMETTRPLFAHEFVAKGKAEGKAEAKAEITKVVKLFIQKKTPNEISAELGIPLNEITEILRESGLMAQTQ